jgi:hypothetical protein
LICAIATSERGGDVMVAGQQRCTRTWFDTMRGDTATTAYVAELAADIDVKRLEVDDAALPVRPVQAHREAPTNRRRRTIPAFDGGRLRRWAAECIASPTGYLYTRVTDWPSDTVQSADGDLLEVAALDIATTHTDAELLDELTAQARAHRVRVHPVDAVARLVFEDTVVTGVVFSTSGGPLAIRARHGVLVCGGAPGGPAGAVAAGLRPALVGRTASRFGRVELLAED